MSAKLPASWERELQAQRTLRARIERLTRQMFALRAQRDTVLARGGRGWVTHVGAVNIQYDAVWQRLRVELAALYRRKGPV